MDSLSIELACSERGSKRAQRALLFTFLMKLTGDSLLKYVPSYTVIDFNVPLCQSPPIKMWVTCPMFLLESCISSTVQRDTVSLGMSSVSSRV